jgi:2-oxoglutarate ferredoxin oxidoreductase subunit delta
MIKINSELCKGCDLCIESCPKNVYIKSSKENKKGVYLPCPKNEKDCNKCHLCELMCPDQAIIVEEDNGDTDEDTNEGTNEDINKDSNIDKVTNGDVGD